MEITIQVSVTLLSQQMAAEIQVIVVLRQKGQRLIGIDVLIINIFCNVFTMQELVQTQHDALIHIL